jgi:hypothetical protein
MQRMHTSFLVTGLILIVVAAILMMYNVRFEAFQLANQDEGFADYFMNAGGYGKSYESIGPFDNVALKPTNGVSQYRNTAPNEPLMGPAFEVGPDNLFMFKNNQCKPECCGASFSCDGGCVCSTPEQRQLINMRGGNRTVEDGF